MMTLYVRRMPKDATGATTPMPKALGWTLAAAPTSLSRTKIHREEEYRSRKREKKRDERKRKRTRERMRMRMRKRKRKRMRKRGENKTSANRSRAQTTEGKEQDSLVARILTNEELKAEERKSEDEKRDNIWDQKRDPSVLKREEGVANDCAKADGCANCGQDERGVGTPGLALAGCGSIDGHGCLDRLALLRNLRCNPMLAHLVVLCAARFQCGTRRLSS